MNSVHSMSQQMTRMSPYHHSDAENEEVEVSFFNSKKKCFSIFKLKSFIIFKNILTIFKHVLIHEIFFLPSRISLIQSTVGME